MTVRDRTVLMVIGLLVVMAGFWFLVLGPKRDDAGALDAKVVSAQKRLVTAQAALADSKQARDGYVSDYAAVTRLGKAVPVDDDTPSLLYQLQSVSQRSKVAFNQFEVSNAAGAGAVAATTALPPGATVGSAGFPIMPFAFTFQGSYFDLQKMLSRLYGFVRIDGRKVAVNGRLLTIDGLALLPNRGDLSHITATVAATGYLLPSDEGVITDATAQSPSGAATPAAATPGAATSTSNLVTGDSR